MFKSGIIVMIITLVSRVLGLGRTTFVASIFGATALTDAFNSSFRIANLFRQLLGEGALGTVFIPVYNDKVKEVGEKDAKKLLFSVLNLLFIFLIIIYAFTLLFSDTIIQLAVSGYDQETKELASIMLKIMSIYIVFIGMSGMICAILNNFKKFAVAASTSIFFNIAIMMSGYLLSGKYGIYSLCIGVVVGGFLQFIIVLPSFFKIVKTYSFKIDKEDKSLKLIFTMLVPMLIGIFAKQFNTIIDQNFASFLDAGGVSALENATRIYNLPLGVFGISIANVVYPTLSRASSNNDLEKVKESLQMGLKFLMFLVIPSTGALIFFSKEIVDIIVGYGNYSDRAVIVTAESLALYSVGLYFYTANHLLSRNFYTNKNTKDPVKFSIISIIANIVLNAILIGKFRHMGLAFATAIASTINFLLLYIVSNKKYIKLDTKELLKFLFYTIISTLIAVAGGKFIDNKFIALIVFGIVYLGIWAYPIKKGGLDVFRGVRVKE